MNGVKAASRRRETSLYAVVKRHLEALGYVAKGEICGCDVVGIRPGEPPFVVIKELKLCDPYRVLTNAIAEFGQCLLVPPTPLLSNSRHA